MAFEGKWKSFTLAAGEDLQTYQYHAVAIDDGIRAANDSEAGGLLQTKPGSGEHGTIGYEGLIKYFAGGTVAKGDYLTVNASGTLEASTSGDLSCGRALVAAASGDIATGIFNFASPSRADISDA